MKLILSSEKDKASLNILSHLLDRGYERIAEGYYRKGNAVIALISDDLIFAECIEKDLKMEFDSIIFASRHSSKKGIPALTAHTPGNFGKAEYGGKDGELCFSMPEANKKAIQLMDKLAPDGYRVSMEATHHGPLTALPSIFVEIGSSEKNWKDEEAGEVLAEVIQSLLHLEPKKKAVGIGGTHYCPKFTKVALHTDVAVGHVLPKYAKITEETIKKAIERNSGTDIVVMDWKGTPQRSKVRDMVENLGYEVVKAKDLL
ncbi:MAG: D-aminoacyl-tRNA deacylase [Euryarchaeota archaeon]|nr:D-aminoacyl-tRNA deacylase [Euryarchaeota archaeon]